MAPVAGAQPAAGDVAGDVAGAIRQMIAALAQAFAPKALTQRGARVKQQVDEESGAPQNGDLGNQF